MNKNFPKPMVLIILDGWGIAPDGPGNAVTQAKTPVFDSHWASYPHTTLDASGEAVGSSRGEDGNSEIGHLNLGAGQIVFQELTRINMSIADGSFYQVSAFKSATDHVRKNKSFLHLIGLVGAGGVHSSLEHLFALLNFARSEKINNVYLHLFTDGRDSAPNSAINYIAKVEAKINQIGFGKIATICGRYYAMDRDNRWERTQRAYEAIAMGLGKSANTAEEGIRQSYSSGKSDEFIDPIVLDQKGIVNDKDAVIFFNFRIDRPRQLTKAFVLPEFETLEIKKSAFDPYAEKYGLKQYQPPPKTTTFIRKKIVRNLFFVTMTEYESGLPVDVAFVPEKINFPLGRFFAEEGLRQLHLAETEKERHVTYYFNGRREQPMAGEDWLEVPSPKIASYDLQPEMSAAIVTENLIKRINMSIYDFILVNFANPDMVGHTGNLSAGIKACEVVDFCLGKILKAIIAVGGSAIVTADHGNVEEMINLKTGEIDTKHSNNPVPLIIVDQKYKNFNQTLPRGILADVAPTILSLIGKEKPLVMTGRSLILL